MDLSNRFKKINFILQELELALSIIQYAPDDFTARTLTRHILIRAENFICHIRQLRKPLNLRNFNTSDFHEQKEIYVKYFDEYFSIVRDKLGGHVQDLDFIKRIELWNAVELVKVSFFVESAKIIYINILGGLGIPEYMPYQCLPELNDSKLKSILDDFKESKPQLNGVEVGADPLATTRPNTVAVMSGGGINERAGQLDLIRRWVKVQLVLLNSVNGFSDTTRILKARLVTDIVSFCDCLITRTVTPGSPQEMDGLNSILRNMGANVSVIDEFLKNYRFNKKIEDLRLIRDRFCAHLEIDDSVTQSQLIEILNGISIESLINFYEKLLTVFHKTCRTNFPVLSSYAIDDQPIYGVGTSSQSPFVVPFSEDSLAEQQLIIGIDYNDISAYENNLKMWLDGTNNKTAEARHFFYKAFLHSEVVEIISEEESLNSGTRYLKNQFLKVHKFILNFLDRETDKKIIERIFQLLYSCRNGAPYPLSELALRYANTHPEILGDAFICNYLGEVTSWPHAKVKKFLEKRASCTGTAWSVKFHSILALFKIFIRSEGLSRINHKPIKLTCEETIKPFLFRLTEGQKLLCLLSFASQFWSLKTFFKAFEKEYRNLQDDIRCLISLLLQDKICDKLSNNLDLLLKADDYAGVVAIISDTLEEKGEATLAKDLLSAVSNQSIIFAQHDQGCQNFAFCLLKSNNYREAMEIAEWLARHNPDMVSMQLFFVRILIVTPGAIDKAKEKLAKIIEDYIFDFENERIIHDLQQHLELSKE